MLKSKLWLFDYCFYLFYCKSIFCFSSIKHFDNKLSSERNDLCIYVLSLGSRHGQSWTEGLFAETRCTVWSQGMSRKKLWSDLHYLLRYSYTNRRYMWKGQNHGRRTHMVTILQKWNLSKTINKCQLDEWQIASVIRRLCLT